MSKLVQLAVAIACLATPAMAEESPSVPPALPSVPAAAESPKETASDILKQLSESAANLKPHVDKNAFAEAKTLADAIRDAAVRLIDNPGALEPETAKNMQGAAREVKVSAEMISKSSSDGNANFVRYAYRELTAAIAKVQDYYKPKPKPEPPKKAEPRKEDLKSDLSADTTPKSAPTDTAPKSPVKAKVSDTAAAKAKPAAAPDSQKKVQPKKK